MASDLRAWLHDKELDRYAEAFAANGVDLDVLAELSEAELTALGVSLGDRKRLARALRQNDGPSPEPPAGQADRGQQLVHGPAERRWVTVLFCDLVGSTELSDRLDPEELRELISTYQDAVVAAIVRFRGYVSNFRGDGIIAYFGWPRAPAATGADRHQHRPSGDQRYRHRRRPVDRRRRPDAQSGGPAAGDGKSGGDPDRRTDARRDRAPFPRRTVATARREGAGGADRRLAGHYAGTGGDALPGARSARRPAYRPKPGAVAADQALGRSPARRWPRRAAERRGRRRKIPAARGARRGSSCAARHPAALSVLSAPWRHPAPSHHPPARAFLRYRRRR